MKKSYRGKERIQLSENRKRLGDPKYYNNRELSWLAFNERVLQEALDQRNPLLERCKFLAIFSSNLDEFFMVRVAGLKDQVEAGFNKPENKAGLTPKEQLAAISKKNHQLVDMQSSTFKHVLLPMLADENITFLTMDDLDQQMKLNMEQYFDDQVFPVLTPMAVDAYRPFPMLANKSINLAVLLEDENAKNDIVELEEVVKTAIVQVPSVLKRFIKVDIPYSNITYFIMLEDIISHFIYKLFAGYKVISVTEFRITRNADMTIHEEGARDLLKEIEKELKKRKWGAAVRLEVKRKQYDPNMLNFLLSVLEIHYKDVYEMDGPIDLTFLFSFHKSLESTHEHLVYETLIPQPPQDMGDSEDLFELAKERDLFFHHPYESFEPIVDFVSDAADDPDVLAIKQTLYRVSGDSPVIEGLKRAAEQGKQVTVLVELKARFDEENNVQWAKELEKAGCHVIYGMTYLKTHSKITLVVRRRNNQIEQFVHLGTGNYNDQTAKIYTDMGIITSKPEFGIDATNFFNYLSGYAEKPLFHHLSMAPFDMKTDFLSDIDIEMENHKKYGDGYIIFKMNSLTDKDLIMKMYEASCAGVKIVLIVRGICCLRPQIPGVSENIRVISIVGRFLEHTRIYYFHHHQNSKMYLSSADLMTRNMEKRVELLFPIIDDNIKQRLYEILQIISNDNVKARMQDENGIYHYVEKADEAPKIDSQMELFKRAYMVKEDEE